MITEEDEFKKRREQFVVNIRKNNREELINKRRNLSHGVESSMMLTTEDEPRGLAIVDERYRVEIEKYLAFNLGSLTKSIPTTTLIVWLR